MALDLVSLDIVKMFLGRTSAENGVLKHIMEIKFARRKPLEQRSLRACSADEVGSNDVEKSL
jgi:hypothetical protein